MQYDVVIVGAGPAGLACAIRLKQLKPDAERVRAGEGLGGRRAIALRRGARARAAASSCCPSGRSEYPGMKVPAAEDDFRILTPTGSYKPVPDFAVKLLPHSMTYSTPFNNHGNFIISLGQLTPWLAQKAESLGVEIFPGFAAAAAAVRRARRGQGRAASVTWASTRTAGPARTSPPGIEIHAGVTVLAEGCRGSIVQAADRASSTSPTGTARRPSRSATRSCGSCRRGACSPAASSTRSAGRPTRTPTRGSFLYHLDKDRVYVGYIVGLDYAGPAAAAVRGVPAVQEPPERQAAARRRRDHLRGRAHHRRRRLAVDADAGDARRHARSAMPAARSTSPRSRACTRRSAAARSPPSTSRRPAHGGRLRRHAGAPPRAARSSSASATSSPAFKRGMWLGLINSAWETLTCGKSPWTLKNTRRLVAPGEARRLHLARPALGASARCRRATASRSCSSPATRTMRASRCT